MKIKSAGPLWLLILVGIAACAKNEPTASALPAGIAPANPNPGFNSGTCSVKPWQVPESMNLKLQSLCVGEPFSSVGTLQLYSRVSKNDESVESFFVDAQNKRWPLKLDQLNDLANGQKIKLSAKNCDGILYGESLEKIGFQSQVTSPLGQQNVAAIRVNYSDSQVAVSTETLRNVFRDKLIPFYKENSYGKTWLSPTVLGTITIPMPATACNDIFTIGDAAQVEAKKQDLPIDNFERLVYFLPYSKTCDNWAGNGEIGRVGRIHSQVWINGYDEEYYERIVGHELGHNLGLLHAKAMDCGKDVLSSNCIFKEYGDVSDTMGSAQLSHFNVYEKMRLGWLDEDETQSISASGDYELLPLSSSTHGVKALKIHAPQISKTPVYYFLEYRQNLGFDKALEKLNGNFYNGITIHVGATNSASLLVNATAPQQLGFANAALDAKNTFSDWWNGIEIAVRELSPERARVSIFIKNPAAAPPKDCQ